MPLGNDWVFTVNDHYKTANKIIHELAEVVSEGGNLMLGIGLDVLC
ncbi:alpha-L-fucosidase [Chryseobacterium sp. TY3]